MDPLSGQRRLPLNLNFGPFLTQVPNLQQADRKDEPNLQEKLIDSRPNMHHLYGTASQLSETLRMWTFVSLQVSFPVGSDQV